MENQPDIQEDEINIRDYINVIIKRKKLILAIFCVAVVVSAVVNLQLPKVYEVTSTVQLGSVNGFVTNKDEAKELVFNRDSLQVIIKKLNLNIDGERLRENIKIKDIPGTNLLTVTIVYPGLEEAFKIHDFVVSSLINQGQGIYLDNLAILKGRLNELEAAIKTVEGNINRIQNLVSELPKSGNISESDISLRIILLQITLPSYESNLTTLRNLRNELKLAIVNAKDFKVFDAPIKPKYPIAPKKKQNVLIAGILSLLFSIFLALFMEFFRKVKMK